MMKLFVLKMDTWTFRLFSICLIAIVSCENVKLSSNKSEIDQLINVLRVIQPENLINSMITDKINKELTVNSTKCNIHLDKLLNGILSSELWALKMLDSSSKIQSGILIGNLRDLGMWDECHSVKVQKDDEFIKGRHCMYTIGVKVDETNLPLSISLSICLPASCSAEIVYQSIGKLMSVDLIPKNSQTMLSLKKVKCAAIDAEPWTIGGIIVIVFFTIFLIFLIACTICDIYYRSTLPRLYENLALKNLSKFSMYRNAKRILSTKVPAGNLPAIQGIRFFSMTWVVLGHEYFLQMLSATVNQAEFPEWTHSWRGLYILVAPFSVDTFFAISGFLTSYLFIKEIWKGRRFNPLMYYVHRYWRLTPPVIVLLLFMIFIFPRMGSGAIWETNVSIQQDSCAKEWWAFLLYIQNFRGTKATNCLGHTWYLAVDMHFFWISPLILYPLAKRPRIGLTILAGFLIASIIIPATIAVTNKYSGGLFTVATISGIIDMMVNFYMVSYTRAGPWLVGIFLGYKIAERKSQPSMSFILFGWLTATLAIAFCVFSYRIFQDVDYEFNDWWEGFYAGIARHIWAGGICWIIYASVYGCGGWLGTFLSLPIFLPFGRISYSIYLVHYIYEYMRLSSIKVPNYFDDLRTLQSFCGDYVVIIFIAFFFSLAFESPFLVLEKMLLGSNKRKKPQTKEDSQKDDTESGQNNNAYQHSIKNGDN